MLGFLQASLNVRDAAIAQLGDLGVVPVALRNLGVPAQGVEFLLDSAQRVDAGLLVLPTGGQAGELLLLICQLRAQALEAVLGGGVSLLGQGHFLDLEATDDALGVVDLLRSGVDLHAQAGGGLVDQVDGLIRQEAAGDVAIREAGGGDQGGVLDAHAVVHLVALLKPAKDTDGVLRGRLADVDLLEAALQGWVLLDVLAVLVQGGRTDQAQLTAGEQRLDHVAGIHRGVATGASTDDGVQLVDEGDDLAVGFLDLVEDGLEALLELAAVLRAREHRAQVQGNQLLTLQGLGDVAGDDAAGQSLDDRGLTHARFTDEHGIVFRAPR